MKKIDLISVIVPAYRQEKTIERDLRNIELNLKSYTKNYEIICVVDGFLDKTYENARKTKLRKIKVLGYKENKGKGYAVRYGMARARGNIIAFIDSGMDINPRGIPLLIEHMKWYESDVIVGSIRHSASKASSYPIRRKIYSVGYHLFTRMLFGLKITDSQRGIKIFKRSVLKKVLPRMLVKRFAFDIEILAVAFHLGFTKIHDGPVELDTKRLRFSSVRVNTVWEMFLDTIAVYYRLYVIKYYDSKNRKNWIIDNDLCIEQNLAKAN